jgi:hypothetical protein
MDKWVEDYVKANRIGLLGKGGSGKALLLKWLFDKEKVRNHFRDEFLLWITILKSPTVRSLRMTLYTQITLQKNIYLSKNVDEDGVKIWFNKTLQWSSKFALFIYDVWEKDVVELLEGLGILWVVTDHSNSKVIVGSRCHSVLLKMGVADKYIIRTKKLSKDESWKLFSYHVFPYNNRNIPENIDDENANLVCHKCGWILLAIKVVGREMAECTYPHA